jgi:DNA adenine methylase
MGTHKTPLRYPGGKQKLTPFVREVLQQNHISECYIEPYAGGAGVAIELLINTDVKKICLNDSDLGIYAFWYSILNENNKFCKEVLVASMTIDEWQRHKEIIKHPHDVSLFDLGFSTFFLNRCNRSGIIKAGVIGGQKQDGKYKMNARFSRNDLIRRIELIGRYKDAITITNMDAEDYIRQFIPHMPANCLVYLDPPYYNKANDLYFNAYNTSDHTRLAEAIQNDIRHKWMLSYDGIPQILDLYPDRRKFLYGLQYTAGKSYKGKEVFIFCDDIILPHNSSIKAIDEGLQTLL